jgi:transcriptional antiterminator RfaH
MTSEPKVRPKQAISSASKATGSANGLGWIAIYTKPNGEECALRSLRQQDFMTYCPMIRKKVRHARQVREVLRPLFPSYLFAQVQRNLQHWRPIQSTSGVRSVILVENRPTFLDDGFIDSLQAHEIDGAVSGMTSNFRLGQKVQLDGGVFDGLIATIVQMDEKDRITLLMELLNRRVKVKVDTNAIHPV